MNLAFGRGVVPGRVVIVQLSRLTSYLIGWTLTAVFTGCLGWMLSPLLFGHRSWLLPLALAIGLATVMLLLSLYTNRKR